jgi:regulator of cell morphogenesis and NO signaling
MNTQNNKTIGSYVTDDYRTAAVFEKYGIDFCCRGNRPLKQVCEQENIDYTGVLAEIENVKQEASTENQNFRSWPSDLLADYIEKIHHRYVEQAIPRLTELLGKVTAAHGAAHPEVYEIADLFRASAGELTKHMKKEELILFPVIRKLASGSGKTMTEPAFGSIQNPISAMLEEHDNEGERFRRIENLSNGYTAPGDACNTYRLTYQLLKEFQDDLHKHIHLENNILFPAAINMEASVKA